MVLFFWLLLSVSYGSDVILTPNVTKTGKPIGLIYITGAELTPFQYVPLCQAIQQQFPTPLYVGIPQFVENFANPLELVEKLPELLKAMERKGLPKNSSVFMAGHSLGGGVLQGFTGTYQYNYTSIYPYWTYKGQILNGAVITRDHRDPKTNLVTNYSIPTLSICGELDSILSRMIEQFYIQLVKNNTDRNQPFVNNKTLLNMPVILINGMSHFEFASGSMPPDILASDLIPEIDMSTAHQIVSKYMACWMALQLSIEGYCSFDFIYDGVYQSQTLTNPMIAALILEGSYWLKYPCNCNNSICHSTSYCEGGSPLNDDVAYNLNTKWIPQEIMCGFGDKGNQSIKVAQKNTDSFHIEDKIFNSFDANIWNNCSSIYDVQCVVNSSTVTQNIYPDDSYPLNLDLLKNSAVEMRHKMKSRQFCYQRINGGYVEEDFEICGKINQHIINWAMSHISNQTLQRYQAYGELLEIGPDIQSQDAVTWTFDTLEENRTCNKTIHRYYRSVNSNYYYAPIKNGGDHYCKLISPAHVMKWTYTDGLRFNLSVANINKTVNITCN